MQIYSEIIFIKSFYIKFKQAFSFILMFSNKFRIVIIKKTFFIFKIEFLEGVFLFAVKQICYIYDFAIHIHKRKTVFIFSLKKKTLSY